MWRSFFLALGIFLMILGGQSLVVDQVLLASNRRIPAIVAGQSNTGRADYQNGNVFSNNGYRSYTNSPYQNVGYQTQQPAPARSRVVRTKEWMPWSLLATGAIIVMYTYSLPPASSRTSNWSGSDD